MLYTEANGMAVVWDNVRGHAERRAFPIHDITKVVGTKRLAPGKKCNGFQKAGLAAGVCAVDYIYLGGGINIDLFEVSDITDLEILQQHGCVSGSL